MSLSLRLAVVLVFALAAVTPETVASAPVSVLDQSFTPADSGGLGVDINEAFRFIAQTFTVGITGQLTGVNISVNGGSAINAPESPLHVAIRTVQAGAPTRTILTQTTLPTASADFSTLITLPSPIAVTAGEVLSIVVDYPDASPPGPGQVRGFWYGGGGYERGALYWGDGTTFFPSTVNGDVYFRTYVVPAAAPPTCALAAQLPGPPAQIKIAVQAASGLSRLVVTNSGNTMVALPTFSIGTTNTLQVTATKIDQTRSAFVTLQATDTLGRSTTCDPALVTVGSAPGQKPVAVVHDLASTESHVTIANSGSGVRRVQVLVNGHQFDVTDIKDDQTRSLDVSSAMRAGHANTLIVIAWGPRGASALVVIGD